MGVMISIWLKGKLAGGDVNEGRREREKSYVVVTISSCSAEESASRQKSGEKAVRNMRS